MDRITAIVLTCNEELHIARCVSRLAGVADRVCVVDSGSRDETKEIARKLGADVFEHPWINYAQQFNWALRSCAIRTEWVLRVDADEYLDEEAGRSLRELVADPRLNGVILRRLIMFQGRPMRHGFIYPGLMLRAWRFGQGEVEDRWMDEHVVLRHPRTATARGELIDDNLNDVSWWIDKHNKYATREMIDYVLTRRRQGADDRLLAQGSRSAATRWLKNEVYARLPGGLRASLYFVYRYVLGRGFLDGAAGFYFCFMQAFWYRMLVDLKCREVEQIARAQGQDVAAVLVQKHRIAPESLIRRDEATAGASFAGSGQAATDSRHLRETVRRSPAQYLPAHDRTND